MFNRRVLLALAASSALMVSAQAQDWKAKYPELVFASIPDENAAMVTERYGDRVKTFTIDGTAIVWLSGDSRRLYDKLAGVLEEFGLGAETGAV